MKTIAKFLTALSVLIGGSYGYSQCSTAPIINSFSPNTGFIGSTVTITGANFDASNLANNVVYFGATKATVTQASFGQLKVIVPVGASTDRISVTNQCNLTAYSKVPFNGIFCPTPLNNQTYQNNAQILNVYFGAYNMIAVDLDLDGRAEVVSSGQSGGISVAVNNSTPGNISFGLKEFSQDAGTVYAADLDGDGKKDIIGRNYSYLNTSVPGNITFGASAYNQGVSNYQIAAGDFNNDGKIDLVGENGNHLYLARNLSTGPGNFSFQARQLIQANIGRATGIQTADVDGDGKVDILISQGPYNRAMTFRNTTPNGSTVFTFEAGEIWSTGGTYPYRCQIADFNKDGKIDFTTCNYTGTNNTAVLINKSTPGNIDMSGLINMPSFVNNYRIQVGDVDGDGYPDIVTKSLGVNQFAVYKNTTIDPDHTSFANPIYYSSSAMAEVSGIVIGDLDGDYVPDIATSGTSSRQIRFHRNTSAQVDVTPPTAICRNVVLALGPDGTATLTPAMVDNGSSDACGLGSITISQSAFNCSHIGPNQVTMVVTDAAGNVDSCTATVNVQPAAIIAAGQTTVCQGETVTLNANLGDSYQWKLNGVVIAGATAQQYIATQSGDYTVVVTNALGCSGESLPTVVVVNNNPTVGISPASSAFLCSGGASLTASESAIYQWKLNGNNIANATQQVYNATVAGAYSVQVIDLFGCSAQSDQVVVTAGSPNLDVAGPSAAIANGDNSPSVAEGTNWGQVYPNQVYSHSFTLSNAGNADLTISAVSLTGGSEFSLSGVSLPLTIPAGQNASIGVDFSGTAISSYAAVLTIESNDCTDPSYSFAVAAEITCSPATVAGNAVENYNVDAACMAVGNYALNVGGNPAASLSYVFSGATTGNGSGDGSGSNFNLGTTNVIVTATNACGTASQSFDVVVSDAIVPTVATQGLTVSLDANGQASITAQQIDNGSFDNCGIASMSVSPSAFDCSDLGQGGTVTVVSDASWKRSTFQTPSPWGTIPMPSIQASLPDVSTYTQNVSNVWPYNGSLVFSPAIPGAGPIYANGGWQFFRHTFALNGTPNSIRIRLNVDNFAEVFINGQKVVYENNYNNSANFNGNAYHDILITETGVQNGYQGGDAYDVVSIPNLAGLLAQGTNEIVVAVANANGTDQGGLQFRMDMEYTSGVPVTLSVTDNAGNVTTGNAIVMVEDNTAPTLSCPSSISTFATSAAGAVVTYGAPVAADNCGIAATTLMSGFASGSTFPLGVTTVSYETVDNSGHTAGCSFDVEVVGIAPVAECPGNITQTADAGQCGAIVNFAAVDNTGIPASTMSYSHAPGSFFPVGTTTVTATATNAVGSSSCSFDVIVTDDEAPVLTLPANISVSNDAGVCGAAVSFAASATDNCGVSLAYSHNSGDVYPVGTTTVSVTATDIHGNVTTGSFNITVSDDEAPVLSVPANITVNNDPGVCGASVSYAASATDNCGVSLAYSHNSGDVFPVGTTTVSVTATDIHGNAVMSSFDITVNDNEAPVVVTQDFTVTLANASASVTTADIDAGSSDNCGILNMSVTPNTWGCGDIGDHTVTLSVKDIHGNIATSTATVHVLGDVPSCSIVSVPTNNTFTGGDPNVIYLGYGAQSTTLSATATGGSGFTYSWSGQNLSSTSSANPVFSPTSAGNYSFTCTVTNSNGCSSTCEISICVFDIRVPGKNGKVYVCKVPPGNPSNTHTIQVSVNAVASHLATGSYLGDCSMGSCSSLTQKVIGGEVARSEHEWTKEVLVYPNPNNGNFNVYVSTDSDESIQIEVLDMTGKTIQYASAEPNLVKEMFMDVTPGVYMIKVTQGEYVQNIRLVKN